jgi:hypothetical protein
VRGGADELVLLQRLPGFLVHCVLFFLLASDDPAARVPSSGISFCFATFVLLVRERLC